jgi:hypothetical protein
VRAQACQVLLLLLVVVVAMPGGVCLVIVCCLMCGVPQVALVSLGVACVTRLGV